ncbi:MAG: SAM-dependent methyltransferase, partial [Rickettsiales bacterium]|nr:SAM-dependent methyltransferase [Rickettsiales bacterium]
KKLYFKYLEENYSRKEDGKFKLTSDFYVISGWKKHLSQQKPMKPGEAKNKLKDYLS